MDVDGDTQQGDVEGEVTNDGSSETPFSCNICKKNYTRVDHLARHYRSHTRERPFVCQTCGKSFARIDLLKRHAANHPVADEEPGNLSHGSGAKRRKTLPGPNRPRAFQACRACAASKLRCEGSQPCLRCKEKSLACEYSQSRASKLPEVRESVEPVAVPKDPSEKVPTQVVEMNIQPTDEPSNQTAGSGHPAVTFQLPTPLSFNQSISTPHPSQHHELTRSDFDPLPSDPMYDHDMMLNFDSMPLVDFLRDPLTSMGPLDGTNPHDGFDSFPKDVLDFGVDLDFATPDIFNDHLQLSLQQSLLPSVANIREYDRSGNRSGTTTPGIRGNVNLTASAQAFKESLWLWTPGKDDHAALEQLNLSLPWEGLSPESQPRVDFPSMHQQISNTVRGKILAMVLRTCESTIYSHVVSNFPSAEILTSLLHNFISFHVRQDMTWIHPATIDVNQESPEFLASMICYGAAVSQVPEIRKLGFALQEALRVANPSAFEKDNRATRELRPLQSFALELDVGLWSGDRRKMELSESFEMPLLTMIRRAGHYRRAKPNENFPQSEDIEGELESKWRGWVYKESFKRLALYIFYRDIRSSMSLLSQPLISYAEVSTDLPCNKELWLAKSAVEWKNIYLSQQRPNDQRVPSLRSCMDDSNAIFENQSTIDVELSLLLTIATAWPLIWQYREMKSIARSRSGLESRHNTLTMNSRHHEVVQLLRHIHLNTTEWLGGLKPAAWLLHEQCMMHLYASLEDVQLLAGKEGEEEARKVFMNLTAWAESSESRQALFHAGQVIRAAREYPKFLLRDATAVAVYHASLVLWAYAVLPKADSQAQNQVTANPSSNRQVSFVRLDGEDGPAVQRFLLLGRGTPCIQRSVEELEATSTQEVPLSEPAEVMTVITRSLQKQHEAADRSSPPLLDNLIKLMHSLGKAAVGRRQR